MGRPKGSPKPIGSGKKKGFESPINNKHFCKYVVEKALGGSLPEKILECLNGMDDAQRAKTMSDLMPYCYPKLQAVEHSGQIDTSANQAMVDQLKSMLKELKEA